MQLNIITRFEFTSFSESPRAAVGFDVGEGREHLESWRRNKLELGSKLLVGAILLVSHGLLHYILCPRELSVIPATRRKTLSFLKALPKPYFTLHQTFNEINQTPKQNANFKPLAKWVPTSLFDPNSKSISLTMFLQTNANVNNLHDIIFSVHAHVLFTRQQTDFQHTIISNHNYDLNRTDLIIFWSPRVLVSHF